MHFANSGRLLFSRISFGPFRMLLTVQVNVPFCYACKQQLFNVGIGGLRQLKATASSLPALTKAWRLGSYIGVSNIVRNRMKPFLNPTVSTHQFKAANDKTSYSGRYSIVGGVAPVMTVA